ncbi:MAG: hypothetical protein ACI89J_003296 [Hyphomicrobiaceae bacterium]
MELHLIARHRYLPEASFSSAIAEDRGRLRT